MHKYEPLLPPSGQWCLVQQQAAVVSRTTKSHSSEAEAA